MKSKNFPFAICGFLQINKKTEPQNVINKKNKNMFLSFYHTNKWNVCYSVGLLVGLNVGLVGWGVGPCVGLTVGLYVGLYVGSGAGLQLLLIVGQT